VTDVRKLRSLTDRLISKVAPEVNASAIWITQTKCVAGCGFVKTMTRRCYDSTGDCTPWTIAHCDC
jgi:hypothetical protein